MREQSRLSRIARQATPSWSTVRTVSFAFLLILSAVLAPVQFGVSPVGEASATAVDWTWTTGGTDLTGAAVNSADGEVYIADFSNGDIKVLDKATGNVLDTFNTNGANSIQDVAYDSQRGVILSVDDGGNVVATNTDGTTKWSHAKGGQPHTVSVDESTGDVYVTDSLNDDLYAYDKSGNVKWSRAYSNPRGIAHNGSYVYVSHYNGLDQVAKSDGSNTTLTSDADDSGSLAYLNDHLYMSSSDNTALEKWTTSGSLVWNSSIGSNNAASIVSSSQTNEVWVGMATSGRIRAFNESGSQVYSTNKHSNNVNGLAVDNSGSTTHLYTASADLDAKGIDTERPLSTELSGVVRDQDGDPVSNATVKAFGFDYANFTGTQAEIQEEVDGIVANISDPTPPDWNPSRQVTGPGGVLDTNSNNDTRVVLAHPQETYTQSYVRAGAVELRKDPSLKQDFSLVYSTSDTVTFTCWDPSAGGLLQDDIDEDLAGKTTSCNLVIEKVGAGGETVTSTTTPTSPFIQTGNIVEQKEHHGYTMREPSAGFYRVYAEGHPETAVTYAVAPRGNINALASIIREQLKNQAGSLEDRAKDLNNYQSDNKVTSPTTTQTNESGQYSLEISSAVDEVSLIAYKAPGSMSVDPNNPPTQADIQSHFESEIDSLKSGDTSSAIEACEDASSTIGSGQAPAGITRASVPESGVTVNTVGSEIPNYAEMTSQICYQADLLDFLRQNDLDGMLAWAQQNLDGMSLEEMRALRKDAWDIARGSESACHSVASRYGADAAGECSGGYSDDNGDGQLGTGSGIPTNGGDATADELKKQLKILQQTVDTMEQTIDSESGQTTTGNGTISKEWFFDTDLSESNVVVKADYSNGTTTSMTANNSEYISVDSRLGQSDTVRLTDYPLGTNDPAMVSFSVIVAGPDGVGRERSPVRNPTFNGNVPQLESIRLSKLSPGPDDRVQIRVTPEDQGKFGSLTDVTVTAPDGGSVTTANITDGRETAFTTQSEGVHHVRLTFSNADGTEFIETVRVNAGSIRHDLPPTVRGETGPTGVFAIASGLESGSIDIQAGGEVVRANAIIGEKADIPASVDVHTTGLDVSSSSTTEFALVRGDTRQSVRRSVTVRFHGPDLGENPVLYREPEAGAQPLPRDGENLYGAVLANDTKTTIETYTTGDGTVSVLTDTDPSRFGRLVYRVRLQAPWIPALVAGVPMPGSGFAGGLSLALLGAGLALTHGRREL